MLVEASNKPHAVGSVIRDQSGWRFTVQQFGRTVHEDSGAYIVMTSCLTMEVEAVTHAIQRRASKRDTQSTNATILTDSMNLLQKARGGLPRLVHSHAQCSAANTSANPATLGIPESEALNGQIDWQAHQTEHFVCSLAGQRCLESKGTF